MEISTFWVLGFLATGTTCTGCSMSFLRDKGTRALRLVSFRLLVLFNVDSSVPWSSLCFDALVAAFGGALERFDRGLEVAVAVVFLEEAFFGAVFETNLLRSRAVVVVATCFGGIMFKDPI